MDSLPPIINPPQENRRWYQLITVEPPMFFYMMAFMVTNVIEQTFYIHKACTINHGYSEEVCNNLSSHNESNIEVQKTVSTFQQWNGIASHIVPLCLAFFLGAWSDKRGRKAMLLAGFIGKLYFSVMITINSIYDWPLEYMIYTAAFPSALTGADLAIFAGCFAYIADVSTIENRTLRVGILDVVYLSTMPTGVAIGNILWNTSAINKSFTIMFTINTCLMVMATVYTIAFLKWQTRPEQMSLRDAGVRNPFTDFFDFRNVKDSLNTLRKWRPSHRRLYLWFLLISMALYTFQRDERPMMYLYTIKVFGWGNTEFSNFRTYLSTAYVLVMLIGIPLMTKVFKLKDTVIIMLGSSAHMVGHFIYAQARRPGVMYVGASAAALGPCVAPIIRSMTSKVLAPAERGVAFAFLSVMENAVAMFSSVLYTQVYNATVSSDFPNAIFYLTMSTQAFVFTFALSMQLMLKGEKLEKHTEQDEKQPTETEHIVKEYS